MKLMVIAGMRNRLFISIGLTICLACSQKIRNNTSMPRSNIEKNKVYMKEGVILNVQPQTSKAKIRDNVVFFDKSCIFMGLGSEIDFAIIHPEFDPLNLPVPFNTSFCKSKGLNLFLTIEFAASLIPKPDIPIWVEKMHDLIFVSLENVHLGNLTLLERLEFKYLVLKNVEFSDLNSLINSIVKIKTLEYLISDNVFTQYEMATLKAQLSTLAFLTTALYNKKIENSEIQDPIFSYEN